MHTTDNIALNTVFHLVVCCCCLQHLYIAYMPSEESADTSSKPSGVLTNKQRATESPKAYIVQIVYVVL